MAKLLLGCVTSFAFATGMTIVHRRFDRTLGNTVLCFIFLVVARNHLPARFG